MKKYVYCYRATDSGLYGDPFYAAEDAAHLKAGLQAAAEHGDIEKSFARRTELYELGVFDDVQGVLKAYEKPMFVFSLSSLEFPQRLFDISAMKDELKHIFDYVQDVAADVSEIKFVLSPEDKKE